MVVCPSCFQQFDLNQAALQRANEHVNVPVLYLSELIALAYGHTPEEIGLDMHRVSVEPFLEKWGARAEDKARLAEHFDVALLGKCDSCQACKDDCPVCKVDPTFQPTEIIGELVRGQHRRGARRGQALEVPRVLHVPGAVPLRHRHGRDVPHAQGARHRSGARARVACRESYAMFLETGMLGKPQGVRAQEARARAAAGERRRRGGALLPRLDDAEAS